MAVTICIVGSGALGSVIAAHLARLPDVEVHIYDVSEATTRAVQERGLRVSGAVDFTAKIHATSQQQEIPPCEFGIVATKSIHTRTAIEQTAHIFMNAAVCSVQNGLGNEEIIAEHVRYVIRGATTMAAHLIAPGHAGFEFYSNLWIGPFEPSNIPYELVAQLAEIMNHAGLRVMPMQDARGAQWTKLIFNAAVNPVGALMQLHHGAATRFDPTGALYEAILREGEAVATALGIRLHGDPREMIAEGARAPGKRNVSMLLDILARRPTEVDFINGAIADYGEKLRVPVPLNRAMWRLIRGLEHSWSDPA
ncbi:MAG TPA: 2-dehydropantoate 2-reductase [Verrucomicrobiae bacterium]|nr:2-dehydropantoate 2-reductase [Verrucomicrobiae bacterium]